MVFIENLVRHIKLVYRNIKLDINEKNFIKHQPKFYNKINKPKYILIQIVTDYYYLTYYKTIIEDKKFSDYTFIGLWPYIQRTVRKRNFILEFLNQIYNQLFNFIIFYKWKKLYRSIGINVFEKLNDNLIILKNSEINNYNNYIKKKNLIDYKIKNIKVGDLIYDTYLRYRALPTLFQKDYYLIKLILKSKQILSKLEELYKKYRIKFFFTSYSSYIHHGIPVRFFIKKKTKVFSGEYFAHYNKRLNINDYSHTPNYKKFFKYKKFIKSNKKILMYSNSELDKKFRGLHKYKPYYMKHNPYSVFNSKKKIEHGFDGVLFLQDFYDSPHDWGNLAFKDYYIWTIFTLNLIRKYKLKIAIKPHPNSWHNSIDSVKLYKRLKNRYKNLIWLDKNCSNKLIFKKIKFGISATGTVLFDLAYHNIKAISCGNHPGINFNFTINAINKNKYKEILLNINNIKKPNYTKNDLLVYNFLYYHFNDDAFPSISRKINLKKINFSNSNGLVEFTKQYNNYVEKNI